MFSQKKEVRFDLPPPTLASTSTPALPAVVAAPPAEWTATKIDPITHPTSLQNPYSYSFSHRPDPLPSNSIAASLPPTPYFFPPGPGHPNLYLGRPNPPPSNNSYGGGLGDAPKAAEPKKDEAKKKDEGGAGVQQQQQYWYPWGQQQPQTRQQVIANAPANPYYGYPQFYYPSAPQNPPTAPKAPEAPKAAQQQQSGGSGLPTIGRYVPPGTVEGALLATWPRGMSNPSQTMIEALRNP